MSDQTTSLFNTDTSTQTNTNPVNSNTQVASNTPDYNNLLASIVNERGEQKYRSIEEAFNGLKNAQEYIPTLKQQADAKEQEIIRLREEALRFKTLEETVAALTSQRNDQTPTNVPVFDENKLAELVDRTLTRKQQEAVAVSNTQSVVATLQQLFGADAEKKFYDKAVEMGMSMAEMNVLASKSPKAVLTMLGVSSQATQKATVSTQGSINTAAFIPTQDTFVKRNPKSALVGASDNDLKESTHRAKSMVDELHSKGMSVADLSSPKAYAKYFNS
jgi:hypothetical protein